jgi:hypothetical protein
MGPVVKDIGVLEGVCVEQEDHEGKKETYRERLEE